MRHPAPAAEPGRCMLATAAAATAAPASTAKSDTTMLGSLLLNRSRQGLVHQQTQQCLQDMLPVVLHLLRHGAVASAVCCIAGAGPAAA